MADEGDGERSSSAGEDEGETEIMREGGRNEGSVGEREVRDRKRQRGGQVVGRGMG